MIRSTTVLALLVLSLTVAPPALAAAVSLEKVRGDLEASDETSDAWGKFKLLVADLDGSGRERLKLYCRGLDDETDYEVLVGDDVDDAVSFGELRVNRRGRGKLKWKSSRDDLPDGIDGLADLAGSTLMIVADDTVILSGEVPEFASLGDTPEDGAMAFGAGTERLERAAGADEHVGGRVTASAAALPGGTHEFLWVTAWLLTRGEDYTVTAVDSDDNVTTLGTFTARGRLGLGHLVLDTFRTEEMPAHVWALGGQTVEVRDSSGTLVLSGTFPDLK